MYPDVIEDPDDDSVAVGGDEALMQRVHYPLSVSGKGIDGRVYVTIVVDENGDIVSVRAVLPPDTERGQHIDRPALRHSFPAWQTALGMSFMWRDPSRVRVPAYEGWRQTGREEKYPPVTDADLVAVAYPSEGGDTTEAHRKRLERARLALAYLVAQGFVKRTPAGVRFAWLVGGGWSRW